MDQQPAASAAGPAAVPDPVFVLCAVRSGSTLLRFVLDDAARNLPAPGSK